MTDDQTPNETKQVEAELEASSPPTTTGAISAIHDSEHRRFSKQEKWSIVCFMSFVGLFSPLTANVYLPALPTLSVAFGKSTELINLTVTMYMVLQGVAPMLWGPVSDHLGRRPTSAICLLILTLSCVGLALVPTSAFWLLMLLRCLQASGSASTIAIGSGVIGDISTRAERGGFYGIFTFGPMIGPSIGPIIGGGLASSLGWRSIFWFLCIASLICLLIIVLFQPETLQSIVDQGRDKNFLLYRPVIPVIGRNSPGVVSVKAPVKVSRNPFRLFLNPDVDVLLIIAAIACAVFYGVIATISTTFAEVYPFLNETTIGLCFLAMGGGMAIGGSISGRVLDLEYRKFKEAAMARLPDHAAGIDLTKEESFPLEHARLRLMPYYILLMAASCAGYGWCLQEKTNIAGPLILQFVLGYTSITIMNGTATLMIDLVPGQSSSVSACNNLVRCTLSAVLVSVIQLIIKAIGNGWTYIILSGTLLLSIPLVYLAVFIGPKYRIKRQCQREELLSHVAERSDQSKDRAQFNAPIIMR